MPLPDPDQLKFPLECHFRIIAESRHGMHFVIETVLIENGVKSPLNTENTSSGGRYLSYSVNIQVESLEHMKKIDAALRSIAGVKMVL